MIFSKEVCVNVVSIISKKVFSFTAVINPFYTYLCKFNITFFRCCNSYKKRMRHPQSLSAEPSARLATRWHQPSTMPSRWHHSLQMQRPLPAIFGQFQMGCHLQTHRFVFPLPIVPFSTLGPNPACPS